MSRSAQLESRVLQNLQEQIEAIKAENASYAAGEMLAPCCSGILRNADGLQGRYLSE
jgi:hypothetical protein